jgi:hypothetical protein
MTPRRGQSTGRINERDYPHIVESPVPQGGFGDTSLAIENFHRDLGIEIKLGRGSYDEGQFYVRYCFADPRWRTHFGPGSAASDWLAAPRPVKRA